MNITQFTRLQDGSLKTIALSCRTDTEQQELQLLNLYPDIQFQQIGVFGGAITDAVGAVLEQLPYETAKKLISGYFGPEGTVLAGVYKTGSSKSDVINVGMPVISSIFGIINLPPDWL